MSTAKPIWRELYRTDDVNDALTVVTTIAAMEFDVRWRSTDVEGHSQTDETRSGASDPACPRCKRGCIGDGWIGLPPYIIEAHGDGWHDLRDVIEDIQGEQWEFEDQYVEHKVWQGRALVVSTVGLVMIPVVVELVILFRGGR